MGNEWNWWNWAHVSLDWLVGWMVVCLDAWIHRITSIYKLLLCDVKITSGIRQESERESKRERRKRQRDLLGWNCCLGLSYEQISGWNEYMFVILSIKAKGLYASVRWFGWCGYSLQRKQINFCIQRQTLVHTTNPLHSLNEIDIYLMVVSQQSAIGREIETQSENENGNVNETGRKNGGGQRGHSQPNRTKRSGYDFE